MRDGVARRADVRRGDVICLEHIYIVGVPQCHDRAHPETRERQIERGELKQPLHEFLPGVHTARILPQTHPVFNMAAGAAQARLCGY